MKKLTLATLSALALTLTCTNVFALDGTITVNGAVTDQTCTLQGYAAATGSKDIVIPLGTISKSRFTPSNPIPYFSPFHLYLRDATGTNVCDAATSKAFKGIHLSVTSPTDDLDVTDKTLLVNKAKGASGASTKNPVFIRITAESGIAVDLTESWGTQERSSVFTDGVEKGVTYSVRYVSKTGIVDAQHYTATVNYTLHYN